MLHLAQNGQKQQNENYSGYESSTSSDVDSLTEDLDQIGRFNFPRLLSYISKDNLPSLLTLPTIPVLGSFSTLPHLPNLPNLPNLPAFPGFQGAPNLPSFDLTELSRYFAHYVHSATARKETENSSEDSLEARTRLANAVKTALATRIQMNTFLGDLRGGLSLQAAIDRLQPLTDIVHEAITLPADSDSDSDPEDLAIETEPVGVGEIVNREQPIVAELVVPEQEAIPSLLSATPTRRRRQRHRHVPRVASGASDGYDSSVWTGSDLEHVEELSVDEARALTHLDLLDDFFKEDLLRQKIQRIQGMDGLSQKLKNKLVTTLMMGNYYRYMEGRREKDLQLKQGDKLVLEETEKGTGNGPKEKRRQNRRRERTITAKDIVGGAIVGEGVGNGVGGNANNVGGKDTKDYDMKDGNDRINNDAMDTDESDDLDESDTEPETELVRQNSHGSECSHDSHGSHSDLDEEVILTEQDTQPSYHNKARGIMGCSHYQRNCKLECPTCLRWFPCRFCHDQVSDHKMERAAVRHVLCMYCNTPQFPDSAYCVNCSEELAIYFCSKCVLYDNDPAKDIYHCDKCGICRLGLGLSKDYFHCDVCNICLSIDLKAHHRCVANTTHCNCPICNEYLFTSVSKVVFMKCGHLIHQACYDEMIKHSYKCPVCKKTVVNAETQFRILDQEIRQLPLPPPYNMWRCIISCNDCKGKCNCAYHVMGLKCTYCHSYNTTQLKLIKPEEETDDQQPDVDERIASMRLIKTNLGSNFLVEGTSKEDTASKTSESEDKKDPQEKGDRTFGRLTKALLGSTDADRTSVAQMFQAFINTTIMESSDDSDAKSDMEIFGGF